MLDISRRHAISHSSVCSGRHAAAPAACASTGRRGPCRRPARDELAKLEKVGAGPDVRLACRAGDRRPVELVVERLVPIDEAEAVAQGGLLEAERSGDVVP